MTRDRSTTRQHRYYDPDPRATERYAADEARLNAHVADLADEIDALTHDLNDTAAADHAAALRGACPPPVTEADDLTPTNVGGWIVPAALAAEPAPTTLFPTR